MKKLMRRVAAGTISAALAGGALLATGGSATAATSDAKTIDLHGIHRPHYRGEQDYASLYDDGHGHIGTYRMASDRFDPWVADQLLMFDPWIQDQLAMFVHSGGLGHRHFVKRLAPQHPHTSEDTRR